MNVQVEKTSTIFPHGSNSINTKPRQIPLTIFDRFATNSNISFLYAFSSPTPPNPQLIQALKLTLLHFPTLTAKLIENNNIPWLEIGAGGALLIEATASSNLYDHLPLEPSPELTSLHPNDLDSGHLFSVQFTRFKCGGLVLGTTTRHKVADGRSMSIFYVAWSQIVRGMQPDPRPNCDLSWLKPRVPPRCEFNHWGVDFLPLDNDEKSYVVEKNVHPSKVTNIVLHYSLQDIAKLKSSLGNKYSTVVTLSAHLWRKFTIARGLDDGENATVRVSINGRGRLNPPVPSEFFGNLVVDAYPKSRVRALIRGGLEYAAKIIHDEIMKMDDKYIRSMIDFGELYKDENLVPSYDFEGNFLSPLMDLQSLLGFRLDSVDLGGGSKVCGFLPTWVPVEGLVMLLPAVGEGGGIDVFVTLLEEHATRMKHVSHFLDFPLASAKL